MELSIALPADLAALANPSAREAAPLLASLEGTERLPAAGLPFALCLELLAETTLSGEPWPADGKELPLPLPADGAALPVLPPLPLQLQPPPALPSDARLLVVPAPVTGIESAEALSPPEARPAALPLPPLPAATNTEPPPLPVTSVAATVPEEPPPLNAAASSFAPLAELELRAAHDGDMPARPAAERNWLETLLASDGRPRAAQPVAAPAAEPRLQAQAAVMPAATPATDLLARTVPTTPVPQTAALRLDDFRLAAPLSIAADPPSFAASEWLPAAGAAGPTTSVATPAATLPSAPVDVRTPSWQESFAARVEWLVETHAGEARIKLNPPELGAVDVKISLVDDKTYVQLTAATAAARDELTQSLPKLRELLTVSGLELGGASVHNGQERHPGGDGTPATEPRAGVELAASADEVEAFLPRRALGRIDVFA